MDSIIHVFIILMLDYYDVLPLPIQKLQLLQSTEACHLMGVGHRKYMTSVLQNGFLDVIQSASFDLWGLKQKSGLYIPKRTPSLLCLTVIAKVNWEQPYARIINKPDLLGKSVWEVITSSYPSTLTPSLMGASRPKAQTSFKRTVQPSYLGKHLAKKLS